jgi:enoyl-CoA hydratase/carnithine racemase
MGPKMVREFQEVINALEADEHVRVVVFDSAVDDYFLITPISWPSLRT